MKIKIKFSKGMAKTLLILFLLISIGFYMFLIPMIRSQTDIKSTSSSISINKQVAISLSGNLSAGIEFYSADPGDNDVNATYNWNHTEDPTSDNQTLYWITIDATTNTPLDICTRTNANLTNSSYWIPNIGYTWNSSTANNQTYPLYPPTTAFTSDFTYDTTNLIANNQDSGTYYIRFAVDVPPGQQAGIYNNTVYFCGRENTTSCSC